MSEHRCFWDLFCTKYYGQIIAYSLYLVNRNFAEAQDLAQRTVWRVLKYSPDPQKIANHLAYVRRVAKNIWLDTKQRSDESLDELLEKDPNNPAFQVPSDLAEILENLDIFKKNAGNETSKLLITFRMRLEGYTWEEIAAFLNEPVAVTKLRWRKFIQRIKDRLKQRSMLQARDQSKEGEHIDEP